MHLRDCAFGVVDLLVENVGYAAIDVDCSIVSPALWGGRAKHTGGVHGHGEFLDDTVLSEYLPHVVFFDVPGQGFNYDLLVGQRAGAGRLRQGSSESCV